MQNITESGARVTFVPEGRQMLNQLLAASPSPSPVAKVR
jgi:hypothetical protein